MKTFEQFTNKPVVSFDFDDTLFMLHWNTEETDYVRDDHGTPVGTLNKKIAEKIIDYKTEGYIVYIITSRYAIYRNEVEDYLRDNNLMGYIDDVIFTNGSWKASTCKKYGVRIHYDDDPQELRRLKYKKIETVKVKNENI